MRWQEFKEKVEEFEEKYWFGEYIYSKALKHLKDVQANPSKLTQKCMEQIIKIFIIQWGRMGRTVDRKIVDWGKLTGQLQGANVAFQRLQGMNFLDTNFDDGNIADAIKEAYNSSKVTYIGPTAISKILHLLNPELFIMWDDAIRERYEVGSSGNDYLDFLKRMQKEMDEALEEEAERSRSSRGEVVERICGELPSKKLGQECAVKTLAKLADEYNWMLCHNP